MCLQRRKTNKTFNGGSSIILIKTIPLMLNSSPSTSLVELDHLTSSGDVVIPLHQKKIPDSEQYRSPLSEWRNWCEDPKWWMCNVKTERVLLSNDHPGSACAKCSDITYVLEWDTDTNHSYITNGIHESSGNNANIVSTQLNHTCGPGYVRSNLPPSFGHPLLGNLAFHCGKLQTLYEIYKCIPLREMFLEMTRGFLSLVQYWMHLRNKTQGTYGH